ncbi:MAG: ParB/RepB/Spo0J family partition protein [Eubacteriales bacterium]
MGPVSKGLGKGLGALLSVEGIPEQLKDSVVELKITDINPNGEQPRKRFDEESLQELASSITENGVIQPIIVVKKGTGYRIVAGERRWRASRLAGLTVIPAIVRDLTDLQTMEQALIENIQRQDLNPLEEAYAMDRLMKEHGLTQEQLSKKLGKSRPAIANTVRLMAIDESLQDYIRNGDLTAGHARALLALPSLEEQKKAADVILNKELSVRETEEYVRRILMPKPEKVKDSPELDKNSAAIALSAKDVERKLTKYFGTKVKLKVKDQIKGKGSLVIEYFSYDDLDRVLDIIGER